MENGRALGGSGPMCGEIRGNFGPVAGAGGKRGSMVDQAQIQDAEGTEDGTQVLGGVLDDADRRKEIAEDSCIPRYEYGDAGDEGGRGVGHDADPVREVWGHTMRAMGKVQARRG